LGKINTIALKEAAGLIQDGDCIAFSGFTIWRRPVALCYELVRQGKKNLHLFEVQGGFHSEVLIGAGCVKMWEGSWMGQELLGKTGVNLSRKQCEGQIIVDDYSHGHAVARIQAGAIGVPFFPTALAMGTDILNPKYDGFARAGQRDGSDPYVAREKYKIVRDPFYDMGELLLMPAINPKVALVYAPLVGSEGTVRVLAQTYNDADVIKAAETVIVICEEIVPDEYLRRDPTQNLATGYEIDYVVKCPWAAHPTGSQYYYDTDADFLRNFNAATRTQEQFDQWADEWIFGVDSQEEYLQKLGAKRMELLRASQLLGYSTSVKRGTR
jgi:glutaconate CoA-transferase subunit A